MRAEFVGAALEAYRALPTPMIQRALGASLGDANIALCLHRVRERGRRDLASSTLVIDETNLDALIEIILGAFPVDRPRLTLSFDDGYVDAAHYIESRRERYPSVEWLMFVCPEKVRKRAGFRWDTRDAQVEGSTDIVGENNLSALAGLADSPRYRMLTVEECKKLAALPRVKLGNHTNGHFNLTSLSAADARAEIAASRRDFDELFGATEHFAFPFGTPGSAVATEHVAMAQENGYSCVWSSEPRPYAAEECRDVALLPRFPVVGTWPARKSALYIAVRAFRWKRQKRIGGSW
jgi:peptidoglycan/xylan/chitin deacetylase (PgdA/CDA1 family)